MDQNATIAPALRYIQAVTSGSVLTCKAVQSAVQRHINDLQTGAARGYYFDSEAAAKSLKFFSFLHHSKGRWAGKPFVLSDWQAFTLYCLFGWKQSSDGFRRFRVAYIEIARKNGKTTFAAGLALYMLIADGEEGSEVYTAATTREQAKICFNAAQAMVRKSPSLRARAGVFAHNIHVPATASKMEALSSDYNTLDGPNPHCVILDEIHAYKTSGLYDIFTSAVGARDQSLIVMITTAGFNKEWFCFQQRKYALTILCGDLIDDELFAIIFTLDETDDWADEAVWVKANPNLGVSPSLSYLRGRIHTAKQKKMEQFNVKTKNLNIWVDAPRVWIDSDVWTKGDTLVDETALQGRVCYGGLDLATKEDFNALVLVFPDEKGGFDVICRFWIPKETVDKRRGEGLVEIDQWIDQGWLRVTEGNSVDYNVILEDILQDFGQFDLQSIAKDAWNSAWMYQQLNSQLSPVTRNGKMQTRVSDFAQTFRNMTSPTAYVEDLTDTGKLRHGGNPVLSWMMRNVTLEFLGKEYEDPISGKPQQARKPSKLKSQKKIDGAVALVMALGEYLTLNWDNKEVDYDYTPGSMFG